MLNISNNSVHKQTHNWF